MTVWLISLLKSVESMFPKKLHPMFYAIASGGGGEGRKGLDTVNLLAWVISIKKL